MQTSTHLRRWISALLSCIAVLAVLRAQDPGKLHILSHEKYRLRTEYEGTPIMPYNLVTEHPYENVPGPANDPSNFMTTSISVRLVYGREALSDVENKTWLYTIGFNVLNGNTGAFLGAGNLRIIHDDANSSNSVYEQQYRLANVAYATQYRLQITSFQACPGPLANCVLQQPTPATTWLPSDIRVEFALEVEKIERLNENLALQVQKRVYNTNAHAVEFDWSYVPGAVEYELEYSVWDDMGENPPNHLSTLEADQARLFQYATRAVTWKNWYEIDLSFPKSDLFFRVRPVGRFLTPGSTREEKKYGRWSTVQVVRIGNTTNPGGGQNASEITPFELGKNWQYTYSFAEEGKNKKVLSYFDGGLRSRQTLTYQNDTKVVLAGESEYNLEGVSALSILPVPAMGLNQTLDKNLFFKPAFNRVDGGGAYTYRHFDRTGNALPLSDLTGAGLYFSASNLGNYLHRPYLPDARKYPLMQTRYLRDGRGWVESKGGVGAFYQLDSERETKYFHSTTTNAELQRLFGHEVGKAGHYRKEYVRDANGQFTVSYLDMSDKSVATALVGQTPANLQSWGSANFQTEQSLLDNNEVAGDVSESSSELFNPIGGGTFTFHYDLAGVLNSIPLPNNGTYCQGCDYDLEVVVYNPDGEPVLLHYTAGANPDNSTDVLKVIQHYDGPNPANCPGGVSGTYDGQAIDFYGVFDKVGNYRVHKVLRLRRPDVQTLLNEIPGLPALSTFETQYLALVDETECDLLCDPANPQAPICDPNQMSILLDSGSVAECAGLLWQMINQIGPDGEAARNGMDVLKGSLGGNGWASVSAADVGNLDHFIYDVNGQLYKWKAGGQIVKMISLSEEDSGAGPVGSISVPGYNGAAPKTITANNATSLRTAMVYAVPSVTGPNQDPVAHNFQSQWSESLARLHREICHYDFCMDLTPSRKYDFLLGLEPDFVEGAEFLQTGADLTDPANIEELINALTTGLNHDPLMEIIDQSELKNCISVDGFKEYLGKEFKDYVANHQITVPQLPFCNPDGNSNPPSLPSDGNIIDFINFVVDYGDNYGLYGYESWSLSTSQKKWRMFVGLYGQIKRKKLEECIETLGCPYRTDAYAVAKKNVPPSDIDSPQDVYENYLQEGMFGPEYCDAFCDTKVAAQLLSIQEACPGITPAGLQSLEAILMAHCLDDCNPYLASPCIQSYNPGVQVTGAGSCGGITGGNTFSGSKWTRVFDNTNTACIAGADGFYPPIEGCTGEFWFQFSANASEDVVLEVFTSFCPAGGGPLGNGMIAPIIEVYNASCNGYPVQALNGYGYNAKLKIVLPAGPTTYKVRVLTHPMGRRGKVRVARYPKGDTPDLSAFTPSSSQTPFEDLQAWFDNPANFNAGSFPCAAELNLLLNIFSTTLPGEEIEPCIADVLQHVKTYINANPPSNVSITSGLNYQDCYQAGATITSSQALLNMTHFRSPCSDPDNPFYGAHSLILLDEFGNWMDWSTIEYIDNYKVVAWAPFHNNYPPLSTSIEATVKLANGEWVKVYIVGSEGCFTVSVNTVYTVEELEENCIAALQTSALLQAQEAWQAAVDGYLSAVAAAQPACMTMQEQFYVRYNVNEYHYTLYYYSQAGDLVRTISPEGVDKTLPDATNFPGGVWNGNNAPVHTMQTDYRHNSLGQLMYQKTPDAGITNLYYDDKQRLRLTKNAKQAAIAGTYTYIRYDAQDRVVETGQINNYNATGSPLAADLNTLGFPTTGQSYLLSQRTLTRYDDQAPGVPLNQLNLRARVAQVQKEDDLTAPTNGPATALNISTYYSYDVHGNVKTLWHLVPELSAIQYVEIKYRYDLISGRVRELQYQPVKTDQFYHKYYYDADNRLTEVFTSKDNFIWEEDARYFHYLHGIIGRTEYGQDKVQGMDYLYTLQGWVKSLNLPGANSQTFEPGRDGEANIPVNTNKYVGRDELAFTLGYNQQDYFPVGQNAGSAPMGPAADASRWSDFGNVLSKSFPGGNSYKGLWNGNIVQNLVDIKGLVNLAGFQGYTYQYDAIHRLKESFDYAWNGVNWSPDGTAFGYVSDYSYDQNGNLKQLRRKKGGAFFDDIHYEPFFTSTSYVNNRLTSIADQIPGQNNQDIAGTHNFVYDEIGNLTRDLTENISNVIWSMSGKMLLVDKIVGFNDLTCRYDAAGNRLIKDSGPQKPKTSIYIRDAQGNVLSIYERTNYSAFYQSEIPIYGNNRIGLFYFASSGPLMGGQPGNLYSRLRGLKAYELTDHLQNILVTISDQKFGSPLAANPWRSEFYKCKVRTASDYYPFGFTQPGNEIASSPHRYGFNGKENDREWGSTLVQDYGFRIYNPALGRFLSVDPLSQNFPWWTPYQFAGNTPIQAKDLDGKEIEFYIWSYPDNGDGQPRIELEKTVKILEQKRETFIPFITFTESVNLEKIGIRWVFVYHNSAWRLVPDKYLNQSLYKIQDEEWDTFSTLEELDGVIEFWNSIGQKAETAINIAQLVDGVKNITSGLAGKYWRSRSAEMRKWLDPATKKAFRSHELEGAIEFEKKTGTKLKPTTTGKGDFQGVVNGKVYDHLGTPTTAFLKNERSVLVAQFKDSIKKHFEKFKDGVDELIIDLENFNKNEIKEFKDYIDKNFSSQKDKIHYLHDQTP